MGFKMKDVMLNGTKEELVEHVYDEMMIRICGQSGLTIDEVRPSIKATFKIWAEVNACMIIATRPEKEKADEG